MDPNHDDLLRRPLYVYNLPVQVLTTLSLKREGDIAVDFREPPARETAEKSIPNAREPAPGASPNSSPSDARVAVVGPQSCSLCALSFVNVEEQRGHLKSDLHNYNLKLKLRGRSPVSEAEFEKLIADLDESLSGSDDSTDSAEEEDDETGNGGKEGNILTALLKKQATLAERNNSGAQDDVGEHPRKKQKGSGKPPLLWFSSSALPQNTYFGIYRAIFTAEESKDESRIVETIEKKQLGPVAAPKPGPDGNLAPAAYRGPHFFLCMIGGGHFAGMVVSLAPRQTKHGTGGPLSREATVLAHKTFHRYTTRRKQGGSQSANDNAKGNAHSAGSSIRRYNEQALTDEVRLLLQEWKGLLDTAELLFIRATGSTNRRTLFGPYEGQILRANDPRIRGFPFSTRRATQNELMRSFIELTRLKVREIDPNLTAETGGESPAKATVVKPVKPTAPKLSEEEETALLHTSQLQAFIRRSKLPALLSYLKSNDLPADFRFQPADTQQNHHAPTPLHLAANQNSAPLVSGLLAKAGADPTIRNLEGRTAFELAGDRPTRDAFRVARDELGEARWDWEAARVPAALARAETEKRDERERREGERREAERRRAEEQRLRREGPKVPDRPDGKGRGRSLLDGAGGAPKSAQEKREEEARGLTPEQRMRLDRERRARAAEERIRRMAAGAGGSS
ncbi:hypothetical protein GGS23DRAFT_612983 [Durotheca rogersii]|uniref:uncharacterized protein n=1 Tax=Durotheca rogersii TaxID=419775 RepID=UPI00221E5AC9|nr:uncharacterized protein GGS23DRAFT_612983 [Durotheca rogersii]KAI5867829.1 hypothetical protein GGS23DRAFT_612983 [Durotheca rogersii]